MPFLLAKILNFQGTVHLIGVGSLSQVNYYARGLKTQRTYTVAAIVPEILNPFFASWVYYIEQAL